METQFAAAFCKLSIEDFTKGFYDDSNDDNVLQFATQYQMNVVLHTVTYKKEIANNNTRHAITCKN